jgi:hypothetical protein
MAGMRQIFRRESARIFPPPAVDVRSLERNLKRGLKSVRLVMLAENLIGLTNVKVVNVRLLLFSDGARP